LFFEVFKSWGFEAARPPGHFDSEPQTCLPWQAEIAREEVLGGFLKLGRCCWLRRKTGSGCGLNETKGPGYGYAPLSLIEKNYPSHPTGQMKDVNGCRCGIHETQRNLPGCLQSGCAEVGV